jgi:hypothetical protein
MQCAYGRENGTFTCLNDTELKQAASKLRIDTKNKSKQEIYDEIKRLSNTDTDTEIIEHSKLSKKNILKPDAPGFYLSNSDIDDVMYQYERMHKAFTSFGAVPYDFKDSPSGGWYKNCVDLKRLDPASMKNKQWAFVVNLDPSIKPGSHWVCVFVSNKNNKALHVEYFDSISTQKCRSMVTCTEDNVPSNIHDYVDRLERDNPSMKVTLTHNKTQHQRKNNECGMYCLYYVLNRVNGVEYHDDIPEISDDSMTKLRDVLFMASNVCTKCNKPKKS